MEPERHIEKVLRAAAAKRRDEPGKTFSLHPADRKALQAEVREVYGSQPACGKPEARGRITLWPQIAWSFALVAGLAVAVTMMLPRSAPAPGSYTLAKNDAEKASAISSQSLDEKSPMLTRSRSGRDEQEAAGRVQALALSPAREAESHGAAPGGPPDVGTGAAGQTKLEEQMRSRYGLAPAAAPT